MKTRSTSRPESGDERRSAANAQATAQMKQSSAATMSDARASSLAQLKHQERASNSSQAAQLKARADMLVGHGANAPVQGVEDEELLQGKFDALQRKDAGAPSQGRFEQMSASVAPARAPIQREEKPNNTGLPNQLKSGIESLSGMSMHHVKVHYNSDKPAQLQAHAYAQGSEIHVAPGQEQHVPHEAWHVVQQAQGRVRPTLQMEGGVAVNDDVGLEGEADLMGVRALDAGKLVTQQYRNPASALQTSTHQLVAQRAITGIANWDQFVLAYRAINDDDTPSEMIREAILKVIGEEHEYDYKGGLERAMELATVEHAAELAPVDYFINVTELAAQLDPDQHRPDLVAYDAETQTITQAPNETTGEPHYRQVALEAVKNVQVDENVDEDEIKSIFFEILDVNPEVPITTGDGRHRIAVYRAMGMVWIQAAITESQRQTLVARGITVAQHAL